MSSEQIRQFLQDVFDNKELMRLIENKAEEFVLDIFTVNNHAREVYVHAHQLHNDQATLLISFITKYSYLDNLKYDIRGKYKKLSFFIYHKDSSNYTKFLGKSRKPYNDTYLIEYKIEFNKRNCFLKDKFGSKDFAPDLSEIKQKMNSFSNKYELKPVLVILARE